MNFRDAVDLEVQFARDEPEDPAALRRRDRGFYLGLQSAPTEAGELLARWIASRRVQGELTLGERIELSQRVLGYGLVVAGLLSGWGTASGLLRFGEGQSPVNLGQYLLVLVFGQLGLLALLPLSLAVRSLLPRLGLVGDFSRLLRALAEWLAPLLARGSTGRAGEVRETVAATYRRVRLRADHLVPVERFRLLTLSQLFGVAFNLGALAGCVVLILFSDLAFGWSTSLASLDATQVGRLCDLLALPFGWLVPSAVPSAELIEHTQYFRLSGRFAGAALGDKGDPLLAGQWWRFLVACTVTYGLLPRVVTWLAFWGLSRRAEARMPHDTPDMQRLLRRMTTPEVRSGSDAQDPQRAPAAKPAATFSGSLDETTALVVYRDVPTASEVLAQAVQATLGLQTTSFHQAGGFAASGDRALLDALGERPESVTVVTEAWEAPDLGLRNFLAALRERLGPRCTLRVALLGEASAQGFERAAREDVAVYRDRLTLLQDPYLTVEVLDPSRPADGTASV